MWSISLKNLRANISRFVATLVAIATGVGFLTASTMVTDSIKNSLGGEIDRQYAAVSTAVQQHQVGQDERGGGGFADFAKGVPVEQLAAVEKVDGVRSAAGEVMGLTRFVSPAPKADTSGFGDFGITVRSWIDNSELNPLQISAGRAPRAPNEVAVDRATAEDLKLKVGQTVELGTADGGEKATVVGFTSFGSTGSSDQTGTVTAVEPWVFTLGSVEPPRYQQILLAADDGISESALTRRVSAVLDDGVEAVTGATFRADQKGQLDEFLGFLGPALLVFSGLALFVCCFVIYNTFAVVVAQRIRELALMRAVAATPRQVRQSLRLEGLGIGVVGSVAGIGLGTLITFLLAQVLVWLDLDLPRADIALTPSTVITGLVIGTFITFISVLLPAYRAGRTAPVEAMREAALETSPVGKVRLGFSIGLVTLGIIGMITTNSWLLGFGAPMFVIGVFLAGPALAYWQARALRRPLTALGIAGRLSADNVSRSPKRTATTTNALVVGMLLVTLVTVAGNSLKNATVGEINKLSESDFRISSLTGPLDPELLDRIEQLDGVATMARLRGVSLTQADGMPVLLVSGDADKLTAVGIRASRGSLDDLGSGVAQLEVNPGTATPNQIGDDVVLTDSDGRPITLETTALLEFTLDSVIGGQVDIVSASTMAQVFPDAADVVALLRVDRDALDRVGAELTKLTAGYGGVQVQKGNAIGQIIGTVFGYLINIVNGLLGMSVVIALIGIVNTLSLSIFERRRELGLLRAVGMASASVRRMIRLEALQMALLGTLSGMVSGTVLAWLLIRAGDLGGMELQWGRLAILFGIGILIGVVAAIVPTRRITKLNILDAISAQ